MQIRSLGQEVSLRTKWLPTPVFLPREFHGQRGLVGYSPLGHKELDMTEHTHKHTEAQNARHSLSKPPLLLECGHMLSNHLYCLQILKLMDRELRPIGNLFLSRQRCIYFPEVAVAIAPSSSVVFRIGGVGYATHVSITSHSNNYFHRASSGVLFWALILTPNLVFQYSWEIPISLNSLMTQLEFIFILVAISEAQTKN